MSIRVRPVTAGDAPGMVALFEATGSPCYCRYLHFAGDKNDWLARCALEPHENQRELVDGVKQGSDDTRGIVAEDDAGAIVGWAKLTPAPSVPKAYGQRYYAGLAVLREHRESTLLLGCFLVHPSHRRRSVSRALVQGAVREAKRVGARFIEALPRDVAPPARDEELWTGSIPALLSEGFTPVGGDAAYPVLRFDIASQSS